MGADARGPTYRPPSQVFLRWRGTKKDESLARSKRRTQTLRGDSADGLPQGDLVGFTGGGPHGPGRGLCRIRDP
jgi:hypothetical protein